MKYISPILTKEVSYIFAIMIGINFKSVPMNFAFYLCVVITAIVFFQALTKNFILMFKNKEAKKTLYFKVDKEQLKEKSSFFKVYGAFCVFAPMIVNSILSYIYLESLTISIIWGILLLDGIVNYFYIKKIKKELLIGEENA